MPDARIAAFAASQRLQSRRVYIVISTGGGTLGAYLFKANKWQLKRVLLGSGRRSAITLKRLGTCFVTGDVVRRHNTHRHCSRGRPGDRARLRPDAVAHGPHRAKRRCVHSAPARSPHERPGHPGPAQRSAATALGNLCTSPARGVACAAVPYATPLRRRRCGTSLRSGGGADGPAPPQPEGLTAFAGRYRRRSSSTMPPHRLLLAPAVSTRKRSQRRAPNLCRGSLTQRASADSRAAFSVASFVSTIPKCFQTMSPLLSRTIDVGITVVLSSVASFPSGS